jgi:hypothetical protein
MSGFIPIKRSLFAHFLFKENRVFSRFEAWLDLIQLASFTEDHTELINGKLVKTGRGEKIASMRFLMKRWNWSMSKVTDYLDLLRSQDMVVVDKESGTNKIVLVNFKKHNDFLTENSKEGGKRYTKTLDSIDLPNNKGTPNDTQNRAVRDQSGISQGSNINKGNNFKKVKKGVKHLPAPDFSQSNLFRKPIIPTEIEVVESFIQQGGTEEMAISFFKKNEGTGWYLKNSPIVNFRNLVSSYVENWNKNLKNGSKSTDSGIKLGTSAARIKTARDW